MSLREKVTTENDISKVPVVSTNTTSALYDRKRHSKAIRVLTVLAYVLSVSLAAILLSIYYIFMWDGQSKSQPQAHISLDSDARVHVRTYNYVWGKEDVSKFFNASGSFEIQPKEENDPTGGITVASGPGEEEDGVEEGREKEEQLDEEQEEERKAESHDISVWSYLNTTTENSTAWISTNYD